MSSCCSTFGGDAENQFNQAKVEKELKLYHRQGPGQTTRLLRAGVEQAGPFRGLLLDIGAGFGALAFELLGLGLDQAIAVDASSAYLEAGRAEAARLEHGSSVQFVHGDFLQVEASLPRAAVVTMDRVICCYPFYQPLLEKSLAHAEQCFAHSYPRDRWYVRLALAAENGLRRLASNSFRTFVHPPREMEKMVHAAGFELVSRRCTAMWVADVYRRGTR